MTTTGARPEAMPIATIGPARLFAGVGQGDPHSHDHHRRTHGELSRIDKQGLVSALATVGLRGRGGAAFPVADKLAATPAGGASEVVVNVSEGEPASHKDRTLAQTAPHLVIDGALTVAQSLRTRRVTIAVRDRGAADVFSWALADRADTRKVRLQATSGGFVSGEARALLQSIAGMPAVPPGHRVLPTVSGLGGKPTFVSNAETFAHIGLLACHGVEWFGEVGASERGTTLVTLVGDLPHTGLVEAPHGIGLGELAGTGGPTLIGGYHGTWVDRVDDLRLDRAHLHGRGLHLGAGVIARLPQDTCALGEVTRIARWLAAESSGQCGPCFFGLPAIAGDLDALMAGRLPTRGLEHLRRRLDLLPGRGACGHPDGAAMFIRTALDVHQAEIADHLAHGTCGRSCTGALPLDTTGANWS